MLDEMRWVYHTGGTQGCSWACITKREQPYWDTELWEHGVTAKRFPSRVTLFYNADAVWCVRWSNPPTNILLVTTRTEGQNVYAMWRTLRPRTVSTNGTNLILCTVWEGNTSIIHNFNVNQQERRNTAFIWVHCEPCGVRECEDGTHTQPHRRIA